MYEKIPRHAWNCVTWDICLAMNTDTNNQVNHASLNTKKVYMKHAVFVASVLFVICVILIGSHAGEKNDYEAFLDALGMRESSDNYHAENRYGYLGRYQMGAMALRDAGFQDSCGAWTSLANGYGIFSESDFLNSPDGQNAAIQAYHTKLCGYIRSYGLDQYIGTVYCDVEITRSGLLAACHLVGVKSMKAALQKNEMVYDANRVPASEYMELFSGYDISEVW